MFSYQQTQTKGTTTMTKGSHNETDFEEALLAINLATWNRPRSTNELRSFVRRHHDALLEVE
jgi:hypothetical protein